MMIKKINIIVYWTISMVLTSDELRKRMQTELKTFKDSETHSFESVWF